MPAVQTNYNSAMLPAYAGMVSNTEPNNLISKQVAVGALLFGKVAKQGTTADLVAPATAAVDLVRGIVVRDQAARVDQLEGFAVNDDALIIQRGVVWGVAGAVCTPGTQVYMVVGTAQAGRYTSTSVSNLPIPGAIFESAAAADLDLVKIRLT